MNECLNIFTSDRLANVGGSHVYNIHLNVLAGSFTAGVFLSRCIAWWQSSGNQAFWKRNDGDEQSWVQQEGFTLNELKTARRKVATRVKKKDVKDKLVITPDMLEDEERTRVRNGKVEVLETYPKGRELCVLYWQNGSGKIWYRVNEPLIQALLLKRCQPERDNVDILLEVKEQYPDAPIYLELTDIPTTPEQQLLPAEKPKLTLLGKIILFSMIQEMIEEQKAEAERQPETVKEPVQKPGGADVIEKFKVAIAYGYSWKDDAGELKRDHPVFWDYYHMFVGTSERRKDYNIGGYSAEMIIGFYLWYKEVTKREGVPQTHLPKSFETLRRRALEFLGISDSNREAWIAKGEKMLDHLLNPTERTEDDDYALDEDPHQKLVDDWYIRNNIDPVTFKPIQGAS